MSHNFLTSSLLSKIDIKLNNIFYYIFSLIHERRNRKYRDKNGFELLDLLLR